MRLVSILLCDDVRDEANNKRILIGVYGNQVISSTRPALLGLNLHTVFDLDERPCMLELELRIGDEVVLGKSETDDQKQLMLVAPVRLVLEEEKKLSVRWRCNDGHWSATYEWDLIFAENVQQLPDDVSAAMRQDPALIRRPQE